MTTKKVVMTKTAKGWKRTAPGGRTAATVVEEWQGVCSERMSDRVALELLCQFIDERGLASVLDKFMRKAAESGLADPAAE